MIGIERGSWMKVSANIRTDDITHQKLFRKNVTRVHMAHFLSHIEQTTFNCNPLQLETFTTKKDSESDVIIINWYKRIHKKSQES